MDRIDRHFAAGRWFEATGESAILDSPLVGTPRLRVREAGSAERVAAVAGARSALGEMEAMNARARANILRALAGGLVMHGADLASAIVCENGCPSRQALALQIGSAAALLEAYAILAEEHTFEEVRVGVRGGRVLVQKHPVGVCLGIVPWNVPIFLACMKLAPAIAAGCPIVLKPSLENAMSADLFAEILSTLDLPAGAVAVLTGGRELGRALVDDPHVDKVSFTGSTAAGKQIGSACAARLCRCTLELGGKSAAILLDDFDLEGNLGDLLDAMLQNNGQVCGAQTRVLVPTRRFIAWTGVIAEAFDALRVGDPRLPETDIGPVATTKQLERIRDAVASALMSGAKAATKARPASEVPVTGYYVEPTLLVDVTSDMAIAREEVFGPVIVAMPYDSEAEAVALANDSPYGLSGSVWSADVDRAESVARRLRTGTVGINSKKILDFGSPFGGMRASGIGRELGPEGIDAHLESKSVMIPSP